MIVTERSEIVYDVVVVGAGAAGVGVGVALRHAGIENFVICERHTVGASFASWPPRLVSSRPRSQPIRLACSI